MKKEFNGDSVIIMSCSKCNANCKHCYISFDGNLDGSELYDMVSKLKDKYKIYINGTEPLMNKEFLKSYELATYDEPITNGLVFYNNYEYIDELKKVGIKEIRLSYHFDMHDIISPVKKEYLHELFEEIKKRGLDFVIMCSLSSSNYMKVPEYCAAAVKFGAKAIKFTNFISQGKAKELDQELMLKKEHYDEFFKLLHEMRDKYDKDVLEIRRCGSFGADTYGKSNFKCDAGIECVCITPDKKVYPCIFFCKEGNEIGYYDDGKIFITKEFINDGNKCLARSTYNGI